MKQKLAPKTLSRKGGDTTTGIRSMLVKLNQILSKYFEWKTARLILPPHGSRNPVICSAVSRFLQPECQIGCLHLLKHHFKLVCFPSLRSHFVRSLDHQQQQQQQMKYPLLWCKTRKKLVTFLMISFE